MKRLKLWRPALVWLMLACYTAVLFLWQAGTKKTPEEICRFLDAELKKEGLTKVSALSSNRIFGADHSRIGQIVLFLPEDGKSDRCVAVMRLNEGADKSKLKEQFDAYVEDRVKYETTDEQTGSMAHKTVVKQIGPYLIAQRSDRPYRILAETAAGIVLPE